MNGAEISGRPVLVPKRAAGKKAVRNRLARIIGHLRAVSNMVEDERDCTQILIQLSAVQSALNNTCKVLLRDYMNQCVAAALADSDADAIAGLKDAVELMLR